MNLATASKEYLKRRAANPILRRIHGEAEREPEPLLPSDLAALQLRIWGADLGWREWLQRFFPGVCSRPFGQRHVRLWEWFEALQPGIRPRPRVEIWPRGGAKSTTAELGCARCGVKGARHFVLYVSETQDQADKHVQAIASILEQLGVGRALNQYGTSKGWRRKELRTENGFNVSAYGLDTASRGVKLDQYRPDLILFDDIDSQSDSARTVDKKVMAITTAIIPAGSADCAMLFVQNKIHEDSIFAMLADGRADFLHDRERVYEEPAVLELRYDLVPGPEGANVYEITGGTPTWAGQGLDVCTRQMNDWGLRAFLREAQHEVAGANGFFFDVGKLNHIDADEVPAGLEYCRGWDLAATEGGGDWSVGVLMGVRGIHPDVEVFIPDVRRGQWGSDKVRRNIAAAAREDGPGVLLRLTQDPGQAGKAQAAQFHEAFADFGPIIRTATGDKATRASGFSEVVNRGNCYVVRDTPENRWNRAFRDVLRRFQEGIPDQQDDDVDAAADAFNELTGGLNAIPSFGAVERSWG